MRGTDTDAGGPSAGGAESEPEPIDLDRFYMKYYIGHKGRFGHEFLEIEVEGRPGRWHLRYANQSNYSSSGVVRTDRPRSDVRDRGDTVIRKDCDLSRHVVLELARIIQDSEIVLEDDKGWPRANANGMQTLEVVLNDSHIKFETTKIGSLLDVQKAEDPEGLRVFYYLIQDIKCFVFSLISLHFKIKPI